MRWSFKTGFQPLIKHFIIQNGTIQHKPKRGFGNNCDGVWDLFCFWVKVLYSSRNTKPSLHACLPNTLRVRRQASTKHKETQEEPLLAAAVRVPLTTSFIPPKSSPGSNWECFSNIPRTKFSTVALYRSAAFPRWNVTATTVVYSGVHKDLNFSNLP